MPDIHDRGRALAIRMLAPRPTGKGAPIYLIQTLQDDFHPETGTVTARTRSVEGSGVSVNFQSQDMDGSIVQVGDFEVLLSPVALSGQNMPTPRVSDMLAFSWGAGILTADSLSPTADSTKYTADLSGQMATIVNVQHWNYAGVACGWRIHARRS